MKPFKCNGFTIRHRLVHVGPSKVHPDTEGGEWQYQVVLDRRILYRTLSLPQAKSAARALHPTQVRSSRDLYEMMDL